MRNKSVILCLLAKCVGCAADIMIMNLLHYLSWDFYLTLTAKVTHLTSSQEPENCFPSIQYHCSYQAKEVSNLCLQSPTKKKVPGLSSVCKTKRELYLENSVWKNT